MLIVHVILAAVAVGAIALRPEGGVAVLVVAAAAGIDALAGADAGPALDTVLPLAGFLTAALSLAAMIERSGLCDRQARVAAGPEAALRVLAVEPGSRVPERRAVLTPFQ